MQLDRSPRLVALALGTTAIFDLTGAVIYRVLRAGMPQPPVADPAPDPFGQATRDLQDAQQEAIMLASGRDGVTLPA